MAVVAFHLREEIISYLFRSLVEMQVPHPMWGEFADRVLQWGTNPRNGNKSDQAHPPIHPTKFTTGNWQYTPFPKKKSQFIYTVYYFFRIDW